MIIAFRRITFRTPHSLLRHIQDDDDALLRAGNLLRKVKEYHTVNADAVEI